METKGEFTGLDVPILIRTAGENRMDCVLAFKTGSRTVRLFFEKGKISFISSNNQDERFGEYLLYKGTISLEQYQSTSQMISHEKKKMGDLLVEQGVLTYEESVTSLTHYILELGTSLFREGRGFYAFLKPGDPGNLPMELFIDHRKLIYEGIRRYNFLSLVVNMIPDTDSLVDFKDSSEQILRYLDTDVEEQSIMEWINGRNTVGSICSYSSLTEFETLKVLAGLGYCGFIQFHKQASSHVTEGDMEYQIEDMVRTYNIGFEFIYRFLNEKGDNVFESVHDRAFDILREEYDEKTNDLELYNYGFLDVDAFLKNVFHIPADQRLHFAENLLKAIRKALIVETGKVLGKPALQEMKEGLAKHEATD
ncbi:MAG: hypothetical protein CO090_09760 [Acidobacteria bacterium CG_4_9_14_3_um_filter_49_7]|nr:MAG: hypothetical protein CO090_09760 [Acidobacteria bacterium CG_4_9_14_3_um_filter_49_7]